MAIGIDNDEEMTVSEEEDTSNEDTRMGDDESAVSGDEQGQERDDGEDDGPLGGLGDDVEVKATPSEPAAAADAPSSEASAEADAAAAAAEAELDEARAKLPWFVVQTYSGFEMRVKMSLEERIRSLNLTPKFGRIIVPQEAVEEVTKGGQKKTSMKKVFPGYIVVQMALNDETWHLVKDTPKVTGFVGDSRNPSPLSPPEVQTLLQQMEGGTKRPRPKKQFEEGDAVKVTDGPFAEFNGTVDEVKPDKGKLRVLISIFGRNTPVELDFAQVEKV